MFGGNKDKSASPASAKSGISGIASHNLLVKGTVVKGDVKAETDIRVDGIVEGTITCDAKVIVGPTGYIKGAIICSDAVLEGRIEGNITVSGLLNLRKSAQVTGEIQTSKLIVEAGAIFSGQCRMGKTSANAGKQSNVQRQAG